MESGLIFLSALGIFIFLIVIRNEIQKKLEHLNKSILALHKQLKQLEPGQSKATIKDKSLNISSLADTPVKDNSLDLSSQRPVVEMPTVKPEISKSISSETAKPKQVETPEKIEEQKPVIALKTIDPEKMPKPEAASEKPASARPETDLEKRIGENWLNKIGIGTLVIGIGFFVKYAIDKNWIGETGRLSIGIGVAFLMAGIAHRLHKKYHAFSSVLMGGSVATLYYTISIGYHDYKLFTQPVAFTIMTGITLFATAMAIWYNRRELAIIGLIGGFTAPFMVAGETNNATVFFTYIAILNTGMLLLSFFKKWIELNRLAFIFSTVYLTSWIFMNSSHPTEIGTIAMTFLIVFFVQFLSMNLVYNVRHKTTFNTWEFIHLLTISAVFYGSFLYVLHLNGNGDLKGVFTVALGTLYVALAILFKRLPGAENNLVLLLSGKAVTFLTLTVFIQFDGYHVTLFWALEAVILYWLGMKANMNLLKNTAFLVTGIATFSLVTVWFENYQLAEGFRRLIFNPAFATGIFVLLCYSALLYLLKKDSTASDAVKKEPAIFALVLKYWTFIAAYLVLLLETIHQSQRLMNNESEIIVIFIFHLVFFAAAFALILWRGTTLARQVMFIPGAIAMMLYAAIGNNAVIGVRDQLLSGTTATNYLYPYYLHYLVPVLFSAIIILMYKLLAKFSEEPKQRHFFTIMASLFGLYLVCVEMDHVAVYRFAHTITHKATILKHTQIAGYTIVWGIYSFALMILGMKRKVRAIRVFALAAFSVTLIKLFVFDIRTISEAGKIIAFISLGVMLLVVSFLYQKLKRMIVDG